MGNIIIAFGVVEIIGGIVLSIIGLEHNDTLQFVTSLFVVLNGFALIYLAMGAKTAFRNEQTIKEQKTRIRELDRKMSNIAHGKDSESDSIEGPLEPAPENLVSPMTSVDSLSVESPVRLSKDKEYRTLLGKSIVISAGTIGRILMHTGNNHALVEFVLEDQTTHKVSCSYDELETINDTAI